MKADQDDQPVNCETWLLLDEFLDIWLQPEDCVEGGAEGEGEGSGAIVSCCSSVPSLAAARGPWVSLL